MSNTSKTSFRSLISCGVSCSYALDVTLPFMNLLLFFRSPSNKAWESYPIHKTEEFLTTCMMCNKIIGSIMTHAIIHVAGSFDQGWDSHLNIVKKSGSYLSESIYSSLGELLSDFIEAGVSLAWRIYIAMTSQEADKIQRPGIFSVHLCRF